ncbi:hypothetical protein CEP88_02405 [Roseobacter denitrificans]|nr:hypothetical protein [Roseobacter denitrificans]AVL51578.1 hypothetical protein CEP88_02405 [Roseobacter denitrificans]SFF76724.1 hypothetical protein SAMN05443635_1027 [Roseobacter denitrificans OCh 114]
MTDFLVFYVRTFAVALPLIAIAILMIGAGRANLTAGQTGVAITVAAFLFGLWFAIVVPPSESNVLNVPPTLQDPPIVLAFLFGGAVIVWGLAWLTPLGRRISMATPLAAIAAFQIPRVMGAVFLIGWLGGSIPAEFALPAGLGDIWAGIAGWQASTALASGAANAKKLLMRANVIGILDFVFAVALGIMTSEGFAHLLSQDAPNIVNDHPLALFPAFFVPIFLGFHLISISKLRAERRCERTTGA